ncbi:MAG: hypothetical protein WAM82_34875 [Thermoanaerobaculia bacterium]
MSTPRNWQRTAGGRFLRAAAVFLSLGLSGVMVSAAAAAPQSNPPASAASAQDRANLRQALDSRYEVLPVQGSIALKPRQPKAGIRTIEVTAEGVAVNGERVTARTLHDWLGADADLVLRLQGLSTAEQRQIFGLEGTGAPPVPPPAAASSPAPAEPDASTGEGDVAEESATAETPEPAESSVRHGDRHTSGSRVNVGGSVTVAKDEVAEEVVAVGGSATVEGEVEDGVTAVGGPARIEGKVNGEVVSVGSSVYLGPHAEVEGDVTSVGGSVHRAPGARVQGRINEVGLFPFGGRFGRHVHFGRDWEPWPFWGGVSRVVSSILFTVFLGLLACVVLLVARVPLERVERQLAANALQATLAGIAFWPLAVAVTLLLCITIIGCIVFVLYPFIALYMVLLLPLGYTAVALRLGRLVESRFGRSFGSPYGAALVGVLLIQATSIVGHLLDLLPGPFGWWICLLGFMVQALVWLVIGFGAVLLARLGLAPGYWPQQGAPVPAMPVTPAPVPPGPYERPAEPLPLSESEPPADWHDEPPR